jgi:hypothetical protein
MTLSVCVKVNFPLLSGTVSVIPFRLRERRVSVARFGPGQVAPNAQINTLVVPGGPSFPSFHFSQLLPYSLVGTPMKALVYHGPKKVSVDAVPDPKLEKLTDVIIELTTTNTCGSDLHMYEGRTHFDQRDKGWAKVIMHPKAA